MYVENWIMKFFFFSFQSTIFLHIFAIIIDDIIKIESLWYFVENELKLERCERVIWWWQFLGGRESLKPKSFRNIVAWTTVRTGK